MAEEGLASTMLNVRMASRLKKGGDAVLQRKGISTTQAVRGLYEYLEREQDIPDFLANVESGNQRARRRRLLLRSVAGTIPLSMTAAQIRDERLECQWAK